MLTNKSIPRALVIGYPVEHARSPLIHNFWLCEKGVEGEYTREAVRPGDVEVFLRLLPQRGFVGGNVTIPHKEEAFLACDRVTERAQRVRAVNTFWFEGEVLVGDNTDGLGFVAHLDQTYPQWEKTKPQVFILGAGGAARGIIAPLLTRDLAALVVANRSYARAEALVAEMKQINPQISLSAVKWEDKNKTLNNSDLVINTTSLGMNEVVKVGSNPYDLALDNLPASAIVADIVYVPLETNLLYAARMRGVKTLDGLGMLLHQAVPGFEHWFGIKPEVDEALRAHLIADLAKKAP